jgi:hypothetical protein
VKRLEYFKIKVKIDDKVYEVILTTCRMKDIKSDLVLYEVNAAELTVDPQLSKNEHRDITLNSDSNESIPKGNEEINDNQNEAEAPAPPNAPKGTVREETRMRRGGTRVVSPQHRNLTTRAFLVLITVAHELSHAIDFN